MKALVYQGPGKKEWKDVPDAAIQEPTDVVVKVDTTTICGTDLHIVHGDVAAVTEGRILGHEAVGTVTAVGDAGKGFSVRDRLRADLQAVPGRVHLGRIPAEKLGTRTFHVRPAGRGVRRVRQRRSQLGPEGHHQAGLALPALCITAASQMTLRLPPSIVNWAPVR